MESTSGHPIMIDTTGKYYVTSGHPIMIDTTGGYNAYVMADNKKHKKKTMSTSPVPSPVEENVSLSDNKNTYQTKYLTKHRAKNRIKTKFKIGRYYYQRIKPKDGSPDIIIKYQCVKTIYSVNDIEMGIVIMKQITPFEGKKFTLDKHECQKFHIKFEPGLEVWPMDINWIPEKKQEKRRKKSTKTVI